MDYPALVKDVLSKSSAGRQVNPAAFDNALGDEVIRFYISDFAEAPSGNQI